MTESRKVLLTATVQSHIAQFHRALAQMLHSHGYEVHVAARDNLAVKNGLKIDWADKVYDVPFSRSPKSRDNIKAYRLLKHIIDSEHYDFIHCNTPMGGIITRLAARKTRKSGTKVIYTAHGFHFYKGASRLAWLTYYPVERFFCRWTDTLITINHEDFRLATKKFKTAVSYIHGVGVDSSRYVPLTYEAEGARLRDELDIPADAEVIMSIGELLPNKNQQMIIKAMPRILEKCPNAFLIIAGNGPQRENLGILISCLGLTASVRLIGYCTHLEKYQKIASVVAACSYREGLPLNIVEAMLADNPVVAAKNRGHNELISDGETGFLVERDDSEAMADRIIRLLTSPELHRHMGDKAHEFAMMYSFDNVKTELENIYFNSKQ